MIAGIVTKIGVRVGVITGPWLNTWIRTKSHLNISSGW